MLGRIVTELTRWPRYTACEQFGSAKSRIRAVCGAPRSQDDRGQHPSSSYTFCHHEVRLICTERARDAVPRDDIEIRRGHSNTGHSVRPAADVPPAVPVASRSYSQPATHAPRVVVVRGTEPLARAARSRTCLRSYSPSRSRDKPLWCPVCGVDIFDSGQSRAAD